MPWWFYLTPLGWFDLYLTFAIFIHESGHFIAACLTGHRIIRFKIGLYEPDISFYLGNILFEFSLNASGGRVDTDTDSQVSTISIFLTAVAGPMLELVLASIVLLLAFNSTFFLYQAILYSLSFITFWMGLEGLVRDIKNIINK